MKTKLLKRITIMTALAGLTLALAVLPSSAAARDEAITVPLRFDRYYSLEDMYKSVQALVKAYPRMAVLEEVGRSDEGRPIYAVTVNNPATGRPTDKPAIYVDGNTHGNEIQGGEICLYLLQYILSNYGTNPEVTELLDRACFYVVPVVNADGRYHFFADANSPNSNRTLRIPMDDDHDGLVDEDGAEDLDGDGNLCMMRKRDAFGQYKTDPADPRLMVRVKPGEKGEWTILGEEGIDNDGDGIINEDGAGYVDPNRNWGFEWEPQYVEQGAGPYPFAGKGLKALAEWIYSKPNIAVGWTFHNCGGMFLRGPSSKRIGEYPRSDVAVYDFVGKQAEKIIPGYKYMLSWKELYPTYGDSGEWLTEMTGAYGFVAEVYQTRAEGFHGQAGKGRPEGGDDGAPDMMDDGVSELERLKFNDELTQGELYKPWKTFKHPVYGEVEIGGWVKMSTRLPAPFLIGEMVHRNAMTVLFSAKNVPEVGLEITEVKALGGGLFRVRTRLTNSRMVPSMSALAQKNRIYPMDMLTVSGRGVKVLAGGTLYDSLRGEVAYNDKRPELQFLTVPSFGKIEHQFLVEGSGELKVAYESRHAGRREKTVVLK